MKRSGTVRKPSASAKASLVVTPPWSALWDVAWMTGPSASGSLKGMPSSMASAPPAAHASSRPGQAALDGYPAVTKGISCLRMAVRFPRFRFLDDADVLVAAAGDVDDEDLPLLHL